jgi:hypothetical protein
VQPNFLRGAHCRSWDYLSVCGEVANPTCTNFTTSAATKPADTRALIGESVAPMLFIGYEYVKLGLVSMLFTDFACQ